MRISVIKSNKIKSILLPDKVEGSYWISDTDSNGIKRNLVSIEANNGVWQLISNKDVYYINNNVMQPSVNLSIGSFYNVYNALEKGYLIIYCSPINTTFSYYEVDNYLNDGIIIGSDNNCHIVYPNIDAQTAIIKRVNDKIYVFDNNSKFGVYINNIKINGQKELKTGDIIFYMGLKIVYITSLSDSGNVINYLGVNGGINDNRLNITVKLLASNIPQSANVDFKEDEVEVEYPLYDENEYFHKVPRMLYSIKPLLLQIDPPPTKVEDQSNPILLTVGPMLTMSMTSLVMGYSAVSNVLNGDGSWSKAMPSIVICCAMLASVLIWPMFTKWYEKISRIKNEKERQKKYGNYIENKIKAINEAKDEQSNILFNNYPQAKYAEETILRKYTTMWQRRIEDSDYLEVNLGLGTIPMEIDIKYPEDHFTMAEDNLKDMVSKLGKEPKMLENVPVVYSLYKNYISGIIGNEEITNEYMRNLLIQILAFHSYDDLKLVIITDEEKAENWKHFKDLPHMFTDDKNLRFFATNNDEYKEVCYYLDQVFDSRKEAFSNSAPKPESLNKTYLIITDCFKKVRDFEIINQIIEDKNNYGFSIVILDNKITNLPDQCQTFVKLNQNVGELYSTTNLKDYVKFEWEKDSSIDYEACSKILANVPIEMNSNDEGQLPSKLGFLEMFDVGKIEQLNVPVRWKESNPMLNLQVPVGFGKNSEKISIDLHEKYHGPHGLIAGMTGSGKSEFIITYILSMAINYHPYEVQFILIDYKGGGLAGAFENNSTGLKLPHLVGTITNLDANEIKRSLASIESELKRRQALFNKAREISGESTIDIYKYQKMYREKLIDEPLSHLSIISDELAELKNQEPEFMEQLISTARIGRSLGVHLILATQKPSGVVDPQIWSNTRFRVCMRVQDKSDSNEVIKCPDAAYLKQTGRFYFQVGYNEVFVLGQAAWAGGKYKPSEKVSKTLDTSIEFINNIGYVMKTIETREKKEIKEETKGEELLNIVKYLSSIAEQDNIKSRPLWLEKIPEDIRIDNLATKYKYQKENYLINPIIGEYDIPSNQEQKLLTLPLSKEGNAVVYGAAGSGKENFITTLIYASMLYYTPEEVNFYIIDFGSESLKMFDKCPLVGNVLNVENEEEIYNLYKMLNSTIEERKALFAEYNGDYYNYCKNSGKTVPNIVVVINNYESYQETYGDLDDELIILSRDCTRYGIYFVITVNTPNGMRFKLKQNFALNYVLQQNNEDDYTTILGNVSKNYPAKIFGRGIIKPDAVYEFQTALATDKDTIPKFIKEQCKELSNKYQYKAKAIPTLPDKVTYKDISDKFKNTNKLILGLNKNDLNVCEFDFKKNFATIVTAMDLVDITSFINPLINQIIAKGKNQLLIINADDFTIEEDYKSYYQYEDKNFNDIFVKLNDTIGKYKEEYEKSNYNKDIFNNMKGLTCIIVGVEAFKNKLNDDNKLKFGDIFTNSKDLSIVEFIFVDSIDKIKKIELESWYKNSVNNTNGIWIGNGINDQFSLKVSQKIPELKEEIPNGFGFVLYRGKPTYIKYIEEFELNIKR